MSILQYVSEYIHPAASNKKQLRSRSICLLSLFIDPPDQHEE